MVNWVYTDGCKIPEGQQLPPGIHRHAAILQYQGGDYCGFQRQKHSPSIQQELEQALSYVADSLVTVSCAGRTDTAVHATHQVVHFDTSAIRTGHNWVQGVNSQLPATIALIWADRVREGFHARFSAQSRTYRYVIDNRPTRPAILTQGLTWIKQPLETKPMQQACQFLLGEKDFSAFRAAGCQSNASFRNVISADIYTHGSLVVFEIKANAFLLHMVRNIVGSLLEVGLGRRQPVWIQQLLAAADRRKSAATAVASGLYLVDVEYPAHFGLPQLPKGPVFLPATLGL